MKMPPRPALSRLPLAFAAVLLPLASLAARPVGSPCPPNLQINEIPSTPPGWTLMIDPRRDGGHHLQSITFFSGDPKEMAALAPDSEKRSTKGYSSTWRFQRTEEGYWIGCSYTDTNMLAIRKLADNISQCDMTQYLSDRKRPGGSVEVVCY